MSRPHPSAAASDPVAAPTTSPNSSPMEASISSASASLSSAPASPGGVRGLVALRLELAKLRHKHLVLATLAICAVQLVWLGVTVAHSVRGNPRLESLALFYQAPLLNAIFLPLLSAIVASTVCDIENRGSMFKELLTMQRARGLFAAKWAAIALALGIVVTVQTVALLAMAGGLGLAGTPPASTVAAYWASTLAVSMFAGTLVEVLSLFSANQFLPLVVGVGLSFLGLFAMYLPEAAAYVVPSAYYSVLSTVGMSYDETLGVASYGIEPWPVGAFALVVAATVVLSALASRAFARREL